MTASSGDRGVHHGGLRVPASANALRMMKAKSIPHGYFGSGTVPTITCVNRSTVPVGRYSFQAMVAAMQKYIDQHFAPVWHEHCKLAIADKIGAGQWGMVFVDTADVAGALGYHDLTQGGMPMSYVFTKTTQEGGEDVAVTAAHELTEMLVDPGVQMWALGPKNVLYAYETCDAVEATNFLVDNIPMSNFQYPSWFELWRKPSSCKFDHLGLCTRPFQLLRGGYSLVQRSTQVKQVFGSKAKEKQFKKEDRRKHRSNFRNGPVKKYGTARHEAA